MRPIRVDSCVSWAVALSATTLNIIIGGLEHCYGLLFVVLLDDVEKNESLAALPGSLALCMGMLTGLVIVPLARATGWRLIIGIGSILTATGLFLSSFCEDIILFILSYGIVMGIGFGFMFVGCVVRIQSYFCKYRATANGLFTAGAAIGTILFGPMVSASFRGIGWRNTLRIEAGLSLIGLLFAPLYGPVAEEADKQETLHYGTMDGVVASPSQASTDDIETTANLGDSLGPQTPQEKSNHDPEGNKETDVGARKQKTARENSKGKCVNMECDFSLFLNIKFLLITFAGSAYGFGETTTYTYMAEWANINGISDVEVGQLTAIIGGTALGSRLMFGYLMDHSAMVRFIILGLALLLIGIISLVIPLLYTYSLLALFSVCFGLSAGVIWSIYYVVIVDFMGEELKDLALGQSLACFGIAYLCSGPTAGLVVEWTGLLYTSIQLAGAVQIMGSLAHFNAVLIHYHQKKKVLSWQK